MAKLDLDNSADSATKADKTKATKPKRKTSRTGSSTRATSLVSMTVDEKEKFAAVAKANGLSLSAFFRFAANEFINNRK